MRASRTAIAGVVARRSLGAGFAQQDIRGLAAYLLQEGRTNELASILRDVQAAWAGEGYVEVIAESAHELSPADVKDIEAEARRLYPQARKLVISMHARTELVGGVRVTIIDKQLDMTTRARLQQFKRLAVYERTT